jgi:hypothetical protein
MGHQTTFDRVVSHLRRQNARAMGAFGLCLYRAANGRRCAVGCLIPNDKYSSDLEGQSLDLPDSSKELRAILEQEGHDLGLVRQLQVIHDTVLIHHWETELEKLAGRYKLNFHRK